MKCVLFLCCFLVAEGVNVSRFNRLAIKESRGGITQPCVGESSYVLFLGFFYFKDAWYRWLRNTASTVLAVCL